MYVSDHRLKSILVIPKQKNLETVERSLQALYLLTFSSFYPRLSHLTLSSPHILLFLISAQPEVHPPPQPVAAPPAPHLTHFIKKTNVWSNVLQHVIYEWRLLYSVDIFFFLVDKLIIAEASILDRVNLTCSHQQLNTIVSFFFAF